jgi:hypothetical protein
LGKKCNGGFFGLQAQPHGTNEVLPSFRPPMEKPYVMLVFLYYDDDYRESP